MTFLSGAQPLRKLQHNRGGFYYLEVDPDPLGVDIPEVLEELLHQDSEAKNTFNRLAHSRKRTLIHRINRIKNIDIQVRQILNFLEEEAHRMHKQKNH